jgi:hypothetical protein
MTYNTYAYDKMRAEASRDVKDFESKFEARIENSREYKQYTRRMPYYMWDGKLPLDTDVEVVPMKAIHLSSDNLERLIRDQERLDQLLDEQLYDKQVLAKLRKDEQVRNINPAVEKAYQKYVMLLELARK